MGWKTVKHEEIYTCPWCKSDYISVEMEINESEHYEKETPNRENS